ncbi:MAG: hypothetical protein Q7T59_02525 [Candidatus Woesebacteria bacterium]|nr:hypothetical protein [Candidatus Woesebacteria bacterium]
MFSPEQFLDMQTTESNDTVIIPVPVGEFIGIIKEIKMRPWQSKSDPSKAGVALDVLWSIDDESVKAVTGRTEVTVKQGIMLDIREDGQGLDMGKGKNIGLGRLREATNLNVKGQPFAVTMFPGRAARVKVEHRVDGENLYAEVKQVARM